MKEKTISDKCTLQCKRKHTDNLTCDTKYILLYCIYLLSQINAFQNKLEVQKRIHLFQSLNYIDHTKKIGLKNKTT